MPPIRVVFNVNDSATSVRAFLARLGPIVERAGDPNWEVDLSTCRYIGPFAVSILASI